MSAPLAMLMESDALIIICWILQINRSKNKWKFHLKDGIMNVNGKDQLFTKATGDAEW